MAFSYNFSEESNNIALSIRNKIYTESLNDSRVDIIDFGDASMLIEEFVTRAAKPSKNSILHRLIESQLIADWNYLRRKTGNEFLGHVTPILQHYNVRYSKGNPECSDYNWYLFTKIKEVIPSIAYEAFFILFEDRQLMQAFNLLLRKIVSNLKASDFSILEKDGKFKRCSWPEWLVTALKSRDNARCTLCLKDLSGEFAVDEKIHIDHIVPISQFGTNDTTNFQLLCKSCNSKKSNKNNDVGIHRHVYWTNQAAANK